MLMIVAMLFLLQIGWGSCLINFRLLRDTVVSRRGHYAKYCRLLGIVDQFCYKICDFVGLFPPGSENQ